MDYFDADERLSELPSAGIRPSLYMMWWMRQQMREFMYRWMLSMLPPLPEDTADEPIIVSESK